jgi:hypothetical protein
MSIDIRLGYLSVQVGQWDLYWNHLYRELVLCRGMKTVWHWQGRVDRLRHTAR